MADRETLERALANVTNQMEAVMAVLANGRHVVGNSVDYNNAATTKKYIEQLIAALPKESNVYKTDPVDFTEDSEYVKIVGKKSKKK